MRRLILCASVAAAAIALPGAAMAAQPAFTTTDLNLRAGPGIDYPVVDTIPDGARVRIQGCIAGYNWCSVVWRGEYGWAQGDYLAALYRGERVVVIDEGPEIGLPIIGFNIGTYWRSHYRHRPFYARIDYFRNGREFRNERVGHHQDIRRGHHAARDNRVAPFAMSGPQHGARHVYDRNMQRHRNVQNAPAVQQFSHTNGFGHFSHMNGGPGHHVHANFGNPARAQAMGPMHAPGLGHGGGGMGHAAIAPMGPPHVGGGGHGGGGHGGGGNGGPGGGHHR